MGVEAGPKLVRLSKRMSELGLASRREADAWIEAGLVKVNGKTAQLGEKIRSDAVITVDRVAQREQASRVTILIHKPVGYVSGQAEDGYLPARVLVTPENHWAGDTSKRRFSPAQLKSLVPAGRLDIDSVGLLVLTQDGRVAKTLIDASSVTISDMGSMGGGRGMAAPNGASETAPAQPPERGNAQRPQPDAPTESPSGTSYLLLGICGAVLLLGLLVGILYKKRT